MSAQSFGLSGAALRNGLLLLAIAALMAGSAAAIMRNVGDAYPELAAGGAGMCLLGALLIALLAGRDLWPRRLILTSAGGTLAVRGGTAIHWGWEEVAAIDWRRASSSRFAPEEPWLLLRDGRSVALEPFGPAAYVAVREHMLLGQLGLPPAG